MAFHNWHELIQMGGYAAYVWPAYAITLGGMVIFSMYWLKRLAREKQS